MLWWETYHQNPQLDTLQADDVLHLGALAFHVLSQPRAELEVFRVRCRGGHSHDADILLHLAEVGGPLLGRIQGLEQ